MSANIFSLSLVVLSVILSSCGSTIPLQVLQPAEMVVPSHIQTIAIIDRSKPEEGFLNFLEGTISGEEIGQDRTGRKFALDGLAKALTRTPRFLVKHTGIELTGSKGGNSFAPPLDWKQVEKICRDYQADALVAIESFDSDNNISYSLQSEKVKKDGKETIKNYYNARLDLTIRIGWRFYDPKAKVILDEFTTYDQANDTRRGDTKEQALRYLGSQSNITKDLSNLVGTSYGMRIAPVWITVNRDFYKSGKGEATAKMEQAARFAKADQWKEAAEIWRALTSSAIDAKTAGRAAYNLAVASERTGNLESAVDWAQQSYTRFGNKKALRYVDILNQRISDQKRLEKQLKTKA